MTPWSAPSGLADLEDVVASLHAGLYVTDVANRVTLVNPEAARMLGHAAQDLVGAPLHDLVHHTRPDGRPFPVEECPLLQVVRTGLPAQSDADVFWHADGSPLHVRWLSAPLRTGGEVRGAVVLFVDAGSQHTRLQEAERLALLGRLSAALSAGDVDAGLRALADVCAGVLVEGCAVHVLHDGALRQVALAGAEDAVRPALAPDGPLARALATGMQQQAEPGALATPVLVVGEVLGAVTWGRRDPHRPLTDDDRALALKVARLTADVLDDARQLAHQRTVAETLQRALLPTLPETGDLEVAARYLPAARGASVGGDWYDAFGLPDGGTCLVIGDVGGHDAAAAAHMGQLRNLLRAVAADRVEEPPSRVLSRLDALLEALRVPALATCLLARVMHHRPHGEVRVRWSSAGHPPPVVVRADGSTEVLEAPGDLVLGVAPGLARVDVDLRLASGDTLWLFTDGLVESAAQTLDAGLDRLQEVLRACAGATVEQACDAVLAGLLGEGPADDVALLGVRVA